MVAHKGVHANAEEVRNVGGGCHWRPTSALLCCQPLHRDGHHGEEGWGWKGGEGLVLVLV